MKTKYILYPDQLPRYLRHIGNLYLKVVSRELCDLELSNYFDFLITIERYEGTLTQKQLAGLMYIDKSSMVAILDFLVQKGFINVEQNPADRRENLISLSKKGALAVSKINDCETKIYDSMLDSVSPEQIREVFDLLKKMELRLKEINRNR